MSEQEQADLNQDDMLGALEALLFASGEPLSFVAIKKVFVRYWGDLSEEQLLSRTTLLREGLLSLQQRWQTDGPRGIALIEVGQGYTLRTNPKYGEFVLAMREQKPQRLSKSALETLAIIAYRQPVTRIEVDDIRGVDSSGMTRTLLDRGMIRIVGKREEPGRPLLYGTSEQFLDFFNLPGLSKLPTLRDVAELNDDSQVMLQQFDLKNIAELRGKTERFRVDQEPSLDALDDALTDLNRSSKATKEILDPPQNAYSKPQAETQAAQPINNDPNLATEVTP